MLDQFTDEEQNDIRVAIDHLERMNNAKSSEILAAIDLLMTMIEDQQIEIETLKDQLRDRLQYIEDWQLY